MYPYRPYPVQPPRRRRRPRLFTKDIETLLYSMGDGPVSLDSTINSLEDCLVEFLTDLSQESLKFARLHGRTRIKLDDVPFAIRNDPLKLGRMNYIREQSARIAEAKKQYDTNYVNEKEYFSDEDEDEEESRPAKKKKKSKKKREAEESDESS